MNLEPPLSRSCAGCDMCCTTLQIRELDKLPWGRCTHQRADQPGCAIWGEHPPSCKRYHCFWRRSEDLLPPELFPPDCGFLVTMDNVEIWPGVVNVCPDPRRPDAWDTPRNRALFTALSAAWNCPVAIVEPGTLASHVFSPRGGFFSRAERPDLFPHGGAGLALPYSEYDDDHRPPRERIAAAGFDWRSALAN
ncbi:hypothetical protein [Phenylobacterium deserti]|uniref:YkgJ family cysteine cluster protein n=1 Tax=Phenylobacterium deserti TaxID=1914756 RepID=A0A328ARJ5_9CAUL|nr:hypothetical protein [Phenylobacterium deserti]RAK56871.1 hypothetical protein DJ018_02555 [Phenylobacterium deserti]